MTVSIMPADWDFGEKTPVTLGGAPLDRKDRALSSVGHISSVTTLGRTSGAKRVPLPPPTDLYASTQGPEAYGQTDACRQRQLLPHKGPL